MWAYKILLLVHVLTFSTSSASDETDEPVLYYYGLEESERGLPPCSPRQACSALVLRYWRAPALVRLCRCARRRRCDRRAPTHSRLELNNRAHLQFCDPVTDWPECSTGDTPLTVESPYDRLNPDELEDLHHRSIQLEPPKLLFNCRCRQPNHWKLNSTVESDTSQVYRCASLPLCKTGDFCGNFNSDMNALYQSCLCPKHHICVHNGGVAHISITELMYRGKGWRGYCQRVGDYSYEEY